MNFLINIAIYIFEAFKNFNKFCKEDMITYPDFAGIRIPVIWLALKQTKIKEMLIWKKNRSHALLNWKNRIFVPWQSMHITNQQSSKS